MNDTRKGTEPASSSPSQAAAPGNGNFEAPLGNGCWPGWMEADRSTAWNDFSSSPFPKRTDEEWRFSDISAVDLSGYHLPKPAKDPQALLEKSTGAEAPAAKIVIANNTLVSREIFDLPEGVVVLPLEIAAKEHGELFRSFFLKEKVELGSWKFARLHLALLQTGVFIFVPENTCVEKPIEIHTWIEGENSAVFPHTLVILGKNSKATVLDHFRHADENRAFACGINDLHLAEGACLNYVSVQAWSRETLAFHINSTCVAGDASATAFSANLGGKFVRCENRSDMTAPGARSVMLAVTPADEKRVIDQRTLQLHSAPGAYSDLLYHNSLDDDSKTVFSGLIKVAEGAHQTDAYQKIRNLMLSGGAEANSMPGLEILADGVRCSHGATTGEINAEELFYFQARGIPKADALRMSVHAFFDSVLEKMEDEELKAYLQQVLHSRPLSARLASS